MAFTFGFNIGPKLLGIDFSAIDSVAKHALGTIAFDSKGRALVYIKANGTIGKGKLVKAASAADPYTNVVIATASATGTTVLGMAPQALAAGNYAWIVKQGIFEDDAAIVTASVAPGDPLESDASGACTIAAAASVNNALGTLLVDDGDNTGSVYLLC